MILRFVLAAAAVTVAVGAVVAQSNPIAERQALMKSNGRFTGLGAKMIKGEEAFDLTKAKAVFANYENVAAKLPGLFPDNSKTGGETIASPKIWEDRAGFEAAVGKFGADAKAASASVKDLDSFKAGFAAVTKNCVSCHETFRLKKS